MEHNPRPAFQGYKLTKESNTNFYYSFFSLPEEKRKALYAIYALCRSLDDVTDESPGRPEAPEALLRWTTEIINMYEGTPAHPLTVALKPYL